MGGKHSLIFFAFISFMQLSLLNRGGTLPPHYIWGRLLAGCVIRSPANVDAAKRDELITGHEKPDAGGAIQCKLKVSL